MKTRAISTVFAQRRMASRIRRARSSQARLLSPWRNAFIVTRTLPASVLGPVQDRQGLRRRASFAWRARRSLVQPFALRSAKLLFAARLGAKGFMTKAFCRLQHFVRRNFSANALVCPAARQARRGC
jgi:hypothetical protein